MNQEPNEHPAPETRPADPPPLPNSPGLRDLFEALLRHPAAIAAHPGTSGGRVLGIFGMIALLSLAVYGFVLGTFACHEQLWAAPLKVAAGLIFAGLICYPSLYIFSCLAGSSASATRLAAILGGMLALAGLLLLGFAPAVWIFTQGTTSFGFMGTLALAAWLVALGFGFRFLKTALAQHAASRRAPLTIWCTVFLLVTLQLTTSLRPILGRSDRLLTDEKKFFLQHWGETMATSLPGGAEPRTAQAPTDPTGRGAGEREWSDNPHLRGQ